LSKKEHLYLPPGLVAKAAKEMKESVIHADRVKQVDGDKPKWTSKTDVYLLVSQLRTDGAPKAWKAETIEPLSHRGDMGKWYGHSQQAVLGSEAKFFLRNYLYHSGNFNELGESLSWVCDNVNFIAAEVVKLK